jgi:hypothetical protein
MKEWIIVITFIVIFIVIIASYYTMQKKELEIDNVQEIPIIESRSKELGILDTDFQELKNNQSFIIYGEIPSDYIYWNFGLFNTSKHSIRNISMGKYQSFYPGSKIAIICSSNQYAINEVKRIIDKEHYKKYPNRKLFYEEICTDKQFNLRFECCFRNPQEKMPHFNFKRYTFDDIYYAPVRNCVTSSLLSDFSSISPAVKNREVFENEIHQQYRHFKRKNIVVDVDVDFNCSNTLVNMSEIINVLGTPNEIKVIAIDHFMSRCAIHSQIMFIDADTNYSYYVYFTGIISKKINLKQTKNYHIIEWTAPKNVKRIKVVERIYYDPNTGEAPLSNHIIPMIVYQM